MTVFKHTCEKCGSVLEYPENTIGLIKKYLDAKGYEHTDTEAGILIHYPRCDYHFYVKQHVSHINTLIVHLSEREGRLTQEIQADILKSNQGAENEG